MKVYIVDDSEAVIERLKTMLSEVPEIDVVGEAQNPSDAISGIRKLRPDAVILDIRMPGGSGIGVLLTLKQEYSAPTVIMLTNYPYQEYRKKCMEAGADFFFDKSTEFGEILGVLSQMMGAF